MSPIFLSLGIPSCLCKAPFLTVLAALLKDLSSIRLRRSVRNASSNVCLAGDLAATVRVSTNGALGSAPMPVSLLFRS